MYGWLPDVKDLDKIGLASSLSWFDYWLRSCETLRISGQDAVKIHLVM